MNRSVVQFLGVPVAAIVLCSCGGQPKEEQVAVSAPVQMTTQLQSFSQDLKSSLKSLTCKPGETVMVPVTVRNTSQDAWSSVGQYPVNVSYKWFDNGTMLPIEGERTALRVPLNPGESETVQVKVVAPQSSEASLLKITLVQEGVQWFMVAGAKPLEIPVNLH